MYEQWKKQARKAREKLKSDITESHMSSLAGTLEKERDEILRLYNEIRGHVAPSADLRRKVDACEAVTHDIIKIIYERLTGIDGDFEDIISVNCWTVSMRYPSTVPLLHVQVSLIIPHLPVSI